MDNVIVHVRQLLHTNAHPKQVSTTHKPKVDENVQLKNNI